MSSFTFENKGTYTYLVYEVAESDSLDSMNLGMLTNNKIPGLATTLFTQSDNRKYLKYNVSAKISAKQFLSGSVNKKRIIGVFSGIVDAMLSSEDYMISQSALVLDLEYIFSEVSSCETVMICLPLVNKETQTTDLGDFFRNIMFSTQFDQTENCDYVAKIINYLNSSPVFSLINFKRLLLEIKNDSKGNNENNLKTQTTVKQSVDVSNFQATVQSVAPNQKKTIQQPVVQPVAAVQQQTVVQQPIQATVQQPLPKKSAKNKQQAVLPVVSQNPSVSTSQFQGKPEKKISLFGLLMHYSKENKELYNVQKAEKKAAKSKAAKPVSTPIPSKKSSQKPTTNNYAIPGSENNVSYAIPGQPVSIVQPKKQSQVTTPSVKPVMTPQTHGNPIASQQVQPFYVPQQFSQGQSANFGETTVLGGGGAIGETTVLGASSSQVQVQPHLIRTKNNERINLDKPVFRIGKERSYVDYFVSDNTAVSRSHANIISRDGQYYIVDTNSTNHTYVNGGMIQSNVETPLSDGARIRLANEDFEFRLY